MALVKDEWVIRSNSTISIDAANSYIRSQLDVKQDDSNNLDINNEYIDNFFADLFDSRDGSLYRIYSTGATNNPSVIAGDASNGVDGYYSVVELSKVINDIEQSNTFLKVTDAEITYAQKTELPDLTDYRVESEIIQIVDNKVNSIQIDEVIIG